MTTAPCDFCGVSVPVPDDHPVDWAICAGCAAQDGRTQQWPSPRVLRSPKKAS